jgi:Arc/MetJ-type ribon-helix-helix transcriptional regulator
MELETLWEDLLSEECARVRRAWSTLDEAGRDAVRRHLQSMTREAGWHPNQRRTAAAALRCIEETEPK